MADGPKADVPDGRSFGPVQTPSKPMARRPDSGLVTNWVKSPWDRPVQPGFEKGGPPAVRTKVMADGKFGTLFHRDDSCKVTLLLYEKDSERTWQQFNYSSEATSQVYTHRNHRMPRQ